MSSYVVRRMPAALLLAPLPLAGVLVLWVTVLDAPRRVVLLGGCIATAFLLLRMRTAGTRLRIDAAGVRLSPAHPTLPPVLVPWPSVQEVVVVTGPSTAARVGVRLRPGAPLPRGVTGLVHDPRRPEAVSPRLTREVPGLDRAALAAAVEAHGCRVVTAASI